MRFLFFLKIGCYKGFADGILKLAKKVNKDKKTEDPQADFPKDTRGGQLHLRCSQHIIVMEEAEAHHPEGHGNRSYHPRVPEVV
jgi:hypothetical protein